MDFLSFFVACNSHLILYAFQYILIEIFFFSFCQSGLAVGLAVGLVILSGQFDQQASMSARITTLIAIPIAVSFVTYLPTIKVSAYPTGPVAQRRP